MASLLEWLAESGARKSDGTPVSSGIAYFYRPGSTETLVTVYSDSDGLSAITQPLALDAGGRAVAYLKVAARVVVLDSTGVVVRLSDRGNTVSAAQVEIQNIAATGTSLTTGSQVPGGLTDLDTFLSNLQISLGAADGKVLIGGTSQFIKDVLGATTSQFFNVKASAYGAIGDGTTDDVNAIQAAANAADAAGGGIVYFPPGTYKLTTTISVTGNKIRFLAATPSAVILKQATNAVFCLTVSGNDFICDGIAFTMAAAVTGRAVSLTGSAPRFANCAFTVGASTSSASISVGASTKAYFTSCTFVNAVAGVSTATVAAGGLMQISGGSLVMSVVSVQLTGAGSYALVGMEINASATSGTVVMFDTTVAGICTVTGCTVPATGGCTFVMISGSTPLVVESGCVFGTSASLSNSSGFVSSQSRDHRTIRTSGSATTYTPLAMAYAYHEVISTGASFQWSTPTSTPTGQPGSLQSAFLVLRYTNTSGGAITPTFGTGYKALAVSVGNNQACSWYLFYEPTLTSWVQVGSTVAYTA